MYCKECKDELARGEDYIETIQGDAICISCYERFSQMDICRKVFGLAYYDMVKDKKSEVLTEDERFQTRCSRCGLVVGELNYADEEGEIICEDCLSKMSESTMFIKFGYGTAGMRYVGDAYSA